MSKNQNLKSTGVAFTYIRTDTKEASLRILHVFEVSPHAPVSCLHVHSSD